MSEQHAPAPWSASRITSSKIDIIDAEGNQIARCTADKIGVKTKSLLAGAAPNSRQIVACVNACEGMRNDELEGGLLLSIMDAKIERLEQQRDELLAVLKEIVEASDKCSQDDNVSLSDLFSVELEQSAKRAIAKAEK